jgi:hypothetical protein
MAKVMEVDLGTKEIIKRDMTADELALQALAKSEAIVRETEQKAKAVARAAIFDRLGITADEAALLLG